MTYEEKLEKMNEIIQESIRRVSERAYGNQSQNGDQTNSNTNQQNTENTQSNSEGTQSNTGNNGNTQSNTGSTQSNTGSTQSNSGGTQSSTGSTQSNSGGNQSNTGQSQPIFYTEDWTQALIDSMKMMKSFYNSERCSKKTESERKSTSIPKQCGESMFKKNTITFNGKSSTYKVYQEEANWGNVFIKVNSAEDSIKNLDKLNELFIEDINRIFGDLSRIKEIMVVSSMLIINGVQYYPLCTDRGFLDSLPFDCVDYFREGLIAEMFDFGYLTQMPYLTTLKIDSLDFVVRKFSYDIGLSNFKVEKVFKTLKNLKFFEVGDECFKAPGVDINTELEEKVSWTENVSNTYHKYVATNADSLTGWTLGNLKTYACNRGNKGLGMYLGGVMARGVVFGATGVLNLGLKTVSGVVKGSTYLLKKAFSDTK